MIHDQLKVAGILATGVSIGRKDDKSTWRIDFAPEATDEQMANAAQIVAAFDFAKAEHNAEIDRQIAALEAQITKRMLIDAAAGTPFAGYLKIIDQIKALRAERLK